MAGLNPRAPIGIFDSGPGGLAVLRELRRLLPNEAVLYLGDTAHLPYELRSPEEVQRFTVNITGYLADRGVKMVVIGCNTASVAGLEAARRAHPDLPVLGMIGPGVRAALSACTGKRIGVMGSIITVESHAYDRLIKEMDPAIEVMGVATTELFRYVERGRIDDIPTLRALIHKYAEPLAEFGATTLILGCTDLTCVRDLIEEVAGPSVVVVDPAEEVVREARQTLERLGGLRPSGKEAPDYRFVITGDDVVDFAAFTTRFVGLPHADVTHVDVLTVHGCTGA